MSNDPDRTDASQISTDREAIRAWADEHEATPYRHRDEGEYRLGRSDEIGESHERADWDDFHSHLEENDRVVIYHGDEGGEPFEVAHRDEAMSRSNVSSDELEDRLMEGETVTSTVTETAVVEEVIVEEATIESELVDTEVTNESVVDVELLSRECTDCQLEDTGTMDATDWFDEDRYLSSSGRHGTSSRTGGTMDRDRSGETMDRDRSGETMDRDRSGGVTGPDRTDDEEVTATEPMGTEHTESEQGSVDTMETERTTAERGSAGTMDDAPRDTDLTERTYTDVEEEYPYDVHLEVEEAWAVTRELTERYTVESRVSDVDVAETDSIEEHDIDVDGLQRNLAESDLFDFNLSADELLEEHDVQTEIAEDDRIHTHFTRSQVVEDEVVDRRHLRADVTGAGELRDFERVETTGLATEETTMGDDAGVTDANTDEAVMEGSAAQGIASDDEVETGSGDVPLSQDEIGKDVVDASGETIGMVTDVTEDGRRMFVDPHPGIAKKIKAALDWGDAGEDDYPVEVEQIDHVTRDEITLKDAEELDEITSPTA